MLRRKHSDRLGLPISFLASFFAACLAGLPLSAAEDEIKAKARSEMVFLLVDKDKLQADLMTWPEESLASERLASFRIAIGKEEGDKQKKGDNRTPEGIYFAQQIIDGKELPKKYGPYAIPIDFPNPLDRSLGKTGYGIWLHGVEKDKRIGEEKVTEGCVAFYNADIESLTHWLMPDHSVVVIARDSKQVNRPEDIGAVKGQTQTWIDAWSNRDIGRYMSVYDQDFRFQGMDWKAYRVHKERIFGLYSKIHLEMTEARVFTHDRYAVAVMNQKFQGDESYRSYGRKILYWKKNDDGQWKLFHEDFSKQALRFLSFSPEKISQIVRNSPSTRVLQEPTESSKL